MKINTLFLKRIFCLMLTFNFVHFSFGQNVTDGGTVGYDQTIYQGEQPETLIEVVEPNGGDPNLEFQYIWFHSGNSAVQFTPSNAATGVNNEIHHTPPPLMETTYYARCVRKQSYSEFLAGNVITITVLPGNLSSAGTIGPNQYVLINEQPDTLFEIDSPSGGNPNLDFEFEWVKINSSNIEEPAEGINDQSFYVPPPLTETTIFKRKARRASFPLYINSNSITIEVEPTSIVRIENEVIRIYPNPATDYLQIEFKENSLSNWQVEIFDIKGSLQKTISLENVNSNQNINLQDLAKGTYLIQLTDLENNKVESFQILKE